MIERKGIRQVEFGKNKTAQAFDRAYRGFACWAMHKAWREIGACPGNPVVDVVERYLKGEVGFAEVRKVREAAHTGACAAGVVGLPRAISGAALQLAAWHTANESAYVAAQQVIAYLSQAAGFRAGGTGAVAAKEREREFLHGEVRIWLREAMNDADGVE